MSDARGHVHLSREQLRVVVVENDFVKGLHCYPCPSEHAHLDFAPPTPTQFLSSHGYFVPLNQPGRVVTVTGNLPSLLGNGAFVSLNDIVVLLDLKILLSDVRLELMNGCFILLEGFSIFSNGCFFLLNGFGISF